MSLEIYTVNSDLKVEHYGRLKNPPIELHIGYFDKLEPLWELCRRSGVKADYFRDFKIETFAIEILLNKKDFLMSGSFLRKPFGQDANTVVVQLFSLLEQAQNEGKIIVALCD